MEKISTSLNRFIYVNNRFKCKFNGSKSADDVHPEKGDFLVEYENYDDFRPKVTSEIQRLFTGDPNKLISEKKHWCCVFPEIISKVNDEKSMVKLIIHLINCSGIILKACSKVIHNEHVYFYNNLKIVRYPFNANIFFHKASDEHEVIWERQDFGPPRSFGIKHQKNFSHDESAKLAKIDTFEKFYSFYGSNSKKRSS